MVGVRGDPRSDLFAIGVMLYELCTGELPFGSPQTAAGLRQRLWVDPVPPRKLKPELPEWLQVVLRCLEPEAAQRYSSGAHLAFDLIHPDQVQITARGRNLKGTGFRTHFKRWLKAAGMHYQPSPLPSSQQIHEVPIVMVAVPHKDVTDATLYSLRQAVARTLGNRPGARLACVTVISPGQTSASDESKSETNVQRHHISALRQWAQPLDYPGQQISFHVLESGDPAQALLDYARGNNVDVIVMGAATHGFKPSALSPPYRSRWRWTPPAPSFWSSRKRRSSDWKKTPSPRSGKAGVAITRKSTYRFKAGHAALRSQRQSGHDPCLRIPDARPGP